MVKEQYKALLGDVVSEAMEQQNVSINDLAAALDITYEHARRIVRGTTIPSRFTLRELVKVLALDLKEIERIATSDKLRKTYGDVPLEMAGKKPTMEPLERIWDQLSEDQQQDLIVMAQGWVKRNKHARAS